VEKRSKKKHEVNTSILTPQAQETSISEDKKKDKKKNKKPKPGSIQTNQNPDGDTSQPTSEVGGKEDRSEKKKQKKRKHKKTSSSNDYSQADHSDADPSEASSPKKQKIVAESHVRVSYFIFPFEPFGKFLCYSSWFRYTLQNVTSPLETIFEDVSPDKVVQGIVKELNNEHQGSGFEKSSSPEGKDEPKQDNSTPHPDDHLASSQMGPQRTSEFEQTNPDEGNPNIEQNIPQNDLPVHFSTTLPTPEAANFNTENEGANETAGDQGNPQLEEEHSTTNTPQSPRVGAHDEHVMNTDEFLNSSSEYERSNAKTGGSNADEWDSVSQPPPLVYLPSEILQGLKDPTPNEALDKLLSSSGISVSTLPGQDQAAQREQDENEARFRREIIEGDMFELLERNPSLYVNVKALFSKLQTPQTNENLFVLANQAEALLEQYTKHSHQLQLNSQAHHAKLKLKDQHFAQAKQRNDEANTMKATSAGAFLQMISCEENISCWKAEIRELEKKIAEEEKRKEEFASQAAAVSRVKIEELAQDGIKEYSQGLVAGREADRLANENAVLRRKLAHTKEQYQHFKNANRNVTD
jgi:hypothetical protein